MRRRPPRSTRTDTLVPYTTLFRSPLGEGVAARIAFRSENSDKGWQVSNTRGERLGEVDKLGVRGSLAIAPAPGTHFDLSVTWWRHKSDTVAGQGIGFTLATNPATGTSNSRVFNTRSEDRSVGTACFSTFRSRW